ncbi:MAG: biopolymer transporter ExbD [Microscillaceae bacterium]|nr:biopolymer transporter ExbD [Microscillaceae bacterium]
MDLKTNTKLDASFSMASMTDIIFQLLLFFMLTSSFVTPAALPVNLPSGVQAPAVTPQLQITITGDLQYFINDEYVEVTQIEDKLKELIVGTDVIVVLNIDKDVSVEYMVKVASIANRLGAKVSIATKVDSDK